LLSLPGDAVQLAEKKLGSLLIPLHCRQLRDSSTTIENKLVNNKLTKGYMLKLLKKFQGLKGIWRISKAN
jgi:hypothetical protein